MINLSLGGGGARGAFHLGLLHYIDQHNIKINSICGTSIGAIIGASYACGVSALEQLEIFKNQKFKKAFKFNLFNGSLLRIDTNSPFIKALIPKKNFEDLEIKLWVTVFDISNAKKTYIGTGKLLKAILASSSLPFIFAPIKIKGNYYVDGGLVDNLPTDMFDSHPVIVSNLHPKKDVLFKKGLLKNFKRSLVQAWLYSSTGGLKNCDREITTTRLFGYSVLKIEHLDELFWIGYEEAKKYFETNPL